MSLDPRVSRVDFIPNKKSAIDFILSWSYVNHMALAKKEIKSASYMLQSILHGMSQENRLRVVRKRWGLFDT
jgi:hypothetical protein